MFFKIAYYVILGKPLLFYLGILTISSLLFTASIGYLNIKGYRFINLRWHYRMARITIIIALVHGLLAMMAYL